MHKAAEAREDIGPSSKSAHTLSPAAKYLRRLDERFAQFEVALNLMAAIVILFVMLLGVAQIFSRKLFNLPIPAYIDVIELIMVLFAFPSLAYAHRLGGHIRMEIILSKFKGRAYYAIEAGAELLTVAMVSVLLWYSYRHFLRAWTVGDGMMDLNVPLWPSKLVVPSAFAVLLVRCLIQLAGYLRLVAHPDSVPIAVPQSEGVRKIAQRQLASDAT
ncbi:MAG: TRAP transporter small permease [Rhodospirillales bacterium]|nr:TRAP transporter small permease [Rhodospirillales bacterium]